MSSDDKKTQLRDKWSIKKVLVFLGVYIGGIFTQAIYIKVSDYINRPILSINIKGIMLSEIDAEWKLTAITEARNIGKTPALVCYNSFGILLPEYSDKQIEVKVNKEFRLNDMTSRVDTLIQSLPLKLVGENRDSIPELSKAFIKCFLLNNDKEIVQVKYSSDLKYKMSSGLRYYGHKKLKGLIGTSGSKIILETQKYFINYKGKTYKNSYYPRDYEVTHKIVDDKIYIECQMKSKKMSVEDLNRQDYLWEPFIFYPHEDLKNMIVEPDLSNYHAKIQSNSDDKISYDDVFINMDSESDKFIYIFK